LPIVSVSPNRPQIAERHESKRMVFNILIDNTDDHAKITHLRDEHGMWFLSPAYDVLPKCSA
jgi:serine/threonine protein kinase HipA of HipAB toxin-antitoxin module